MAFASFAGDYLTYQGNILKSILTYFSNDELRELKLVSKEWNRTVTNILDSREYFHSTVDQHRNLISVVFPLKPQQCSIIFGTKLIFSLLTLKKIRNAHLLNIKEYEKFCVVSGNYLPPVVVQTAEERTSGIEYYFMKEKISHCNFLSHDFRSKSVNVSIFQFHNEFCEKGSLKELKAVLEESIDGPVKGIMVFVKNNTDIPSLFTNLVQSIQSEAFTCAGVSGNARVLLPEVHAGKYEVDAGKHEAHAGKYEVDAGYEAHAGKYDTTLLVFRGQGLRVTSDIFFWNERRREWISRPRFNDFLKSLSELAGPAPVDGARLVYIFECCAVKGLVKKEELNKYFPSVEIVFVRTNINEFFRNTNDGERTEVGTDLHGYSSVFNIYDFSGVQKTWSRLDGDD